MKKNFLLLLFISSFFISEISSQTNQYKITKDFFPTREKQLLSELDNNKISIDNLNEYIEYQIKENLESAKKLITLNLKNAKKEKNTLLYYNLVLMKSEYYFELGKLDSCRYYLNDVIKNAKKNNFQKLYNSTLIYSANYFITKSDKIKANDSINKALRILKNNASFNERVKFEVTKADVLSLSDSINKSIVYCHKLLRDVDKDSNIHPIEKLNLYLILARNYTSINDVENQKKHLDLYFKLANKLSYPYLSHHHSQKANFYFKKGMLEDALSAINKSIKLSVKAKNKYREYLAFSNKATILLYLGKLKESEKMLLKSLKHEKKQGLIENMAGTYEDLSRLNYYLDKPKISKKYFNLAIQTGKKIENHDLLLASFYENKYIDYNENKEFEKALYYFKKFHDENTLIFEKQFYVKSAEIETKYETQQKENEILKLKTETQQKELALQSSKTNTSFALGGLFFILVGGGLYMRKRKKDQEFKLLEESVKSSEQEKVRIGKELHDGIAGNLRKLAHNIETENIHLSHRLLDSYNDIRDLSHQLNNTPMHGELFMDSVFELVPKNKESQQFKLTIKPVYLELSEPYSTHLYRIIQELFTNNLKYANATKTTISVSKENNYLTLKYTDNGVGTTQFNKGSGIKSIENRVTLLKGTISIQTENGFVVTVKIPYTT